MPLSPAPDAASRSDAAAHTLRHHRHEDAQALFIGTLFVSIALMIFAEAGLLTGSTAGAAFLLHYWSGLPLGAIYFTINLPFYWFSWKCMGGAFTLKTFAAVALLSLFTDLGPRLMDINYINPVFAAVLGGLLLGAGILFLARHHASLGGANIVSLYMQDRYGIPAGKVQLAIDCTVLLFAIFMVPLPNVLYSVLAAVLMSLFLIFNHRPGRYSGY